jgi:hypothetical protein
MSASTSHHRSSPALGWKEVWDEIIRIVGATQENTQRRYGIPPTTYRFHIETNRSEVAESVVQWINSISTDSDWTSPKLSLGSVWLKYCEGVPFLETHTIDTFPVNLTPTRLDFTIRIEKKSMQTPILQFGSISTSWDARRGVGDNETQKDETASVSTDRSRSDQSSIGGSSSRSSSVSSISSISSVSSAGGGESGNDNTTTTLNIVAAALTETKQLGTIASHPTPIEIFSEIVGFQRIAHLEVVNYSTVNVFDKNVSSLSLLPLSLSHIGVDLPIVPECMENNCVFVKQQTLIIVGVHKPPRPLDAADILKRKGYETLQAWNWNQPNHKGAE